MREKHGSLFLGGALILFGLYLLAGALGIDLPGWGEIWPVLVIAAGLTSLVQAFRQDPRDSGGVWFGVTAMLCGALFLYITIGRGAWSDLRTLWPAFPAAAALGWLAAWLVRPREIASLVLAAAAGAVVVIGFGVTSGRLSKDLGLQIAQWWPLFLILLGLGYVVQYLAEKH
jgi:hypothetical protein